MNYTVSDIIKEVRIVLDMNNSSAQLAMVDDIDTLTIDEIIRSRLAEGVRLTELEAPHHLLDSGEIFGGSIYWKVREGVGSGSIVLPEDFLRLITFQMSDWDRAATKPIYEDDPLYAMQSSRYPGICGNPQRPVVAITNQPVGLVLEFYSCSRGKGVEVRRARYLPLPKEKGGKIRICEKLREAAIYRTGHIVALSIGDAALATSLLTESRQLMERASQTDNTVVQ